MAYKVTTKSGKVYRASAVDQAGPFLKMQCWDGEHRIPAGEISYIKSTEVDEYPEVIFPLFIFFFVFFFVVLLFWL